MTTPVTFELAKLLKEKGFDEHCKLYYHTGGLLKKERVGLLNEICEAPTIAEVVMWLYEKHRIWIEVFQNYGFLTFSTMLKKDGDVIYNINKEFSLPTEAYLAAISYILNKLI